MMMMKVSKKLKYLVGSSMAYGHMMNVKNIWLGVGCHMMMMKVSKKLSHSAQAGYVYVR